MKKIKTFINSLIEGERLDLAEFKQALFSEYMKSNVFISNQDAISPFIDEGDLSDILSRRIRQGQFGYNVMKNVEDVNMQYVSAKKKDMHLTFSFFANFKDVGSIEETYSVFTEAITLKGELIDGSFDANSSVVKESKSFKPHEALIVENMVAFEEMFKSMRISQENRDCVCSVATLLLLKGIALDSEEKKIDKLAKQLYPYIYNSIIEAKEKYIGDSLLFSTAKQMAQQRLSELNDALGEIPTYFADFDKILADEKLFEEINKTVGRIAEYRINFYVEGVNPNISFVNDEGKFELCDILEEDYELFEAIDKMLLDNSPIDTDEEVLQSMFANMLVLENSYYFDDNVSRQLSMAFSLPLIQSINRLGETESGVLISQIVEKFKNSMQDQEFIELMTKIRFDGSCLERENKDLVLEKDGEDLTFDQICKMVPERYFDPQKQQEKPRFCDLGYELPNSQRGEFSDEAMEIFRGLYPTNENTVTTENLNLGESVEGDADSLGEEADKLFGELYPNLDNDFPWYTDEELFQKGVLDSQKSLTETFKKEEKEITEKQIRKTLYKKFLSEIKKHYNKIEKGKLKCKGKNVAIVKVDLRELAGILGFGQKEIIAGQKEFVQRLEDEQRFIPSVVSGFCDEFIENKTNEIMLLPKEERKAMLKEVRKEVAEFYKIKVKKSKELGSNSK